MHGVQTHTHACIHTHIQGFSPRMTNMQVGPSKTKAITAWRKLQQQSVEDAWKQASAFLGEPIHVVAAGETFGEGQLACDVRSYATYVCVTKVSLIAYIYIYIYIYYTHTHTQRERERERHTHTHKQTNKYIHIQVRVLELCKDTLQSEGLWGYLIHGTGWAYIYIHTERERQREREKERERERHTHTHTQTNAYTYRCVCWSYARTLYRVKDYGGI